MTSTIPMDLLMVVFAAGEGKLATIPPDIAPIIDELRARARLRRDFSLPAGSSSSSPMASEGCPAAYTVTQDGCARVERLCAAHVQRLIAGGASVEPADLSQAGLCDRCAAEEHSALEARRADIARQERKRTEAEVCSLLLLLREAFDTPWAGSDPAHVAEVAALKRRIQEALGGRYSGEDMLAVLEFYANAQNWETVYAGSAADGTQGPDFTPIDLDRGRRARQVLDLLETEEARVATLGGSAVPGR